jgi:hypothetical protein
MTRTELIIQLLKIAIGLAFGAYFVWWSLEVLDRLAPENEATTPVVGRLWDSGGSDLAFEHREGSHANTRLCRNARGHNEGVRKKLATRMNDSAG